ncbi:MAG: hypothetical protein ABS79_00785 [Planctomycetes bacterium SCN 63-9]|nr:MAG: hypothetical protein ABS79_00785 [Planctomycetes bacterium SCN 63-9]
MTVRPFATVLSLLLPLLIWASEAHGQAPTPSPAPATNSDADSLPASTPPSSRSTGDLTRPAAVNVGLAPRSEQANAPDTPAEKPIRDLSRLLGLEDSRWQLYGWIQNSYTATPGFNPRNRSTVTVFPNRLANEWQGNQYYFIVERALGTEDEFDYGFRLDTLFGNDWMFTHSFGLFNNVFTPLGFVGVDFPQMYAELHLPVLFEGGIDLRGGRFYSPAGFESVMAVNRPLLSVPYLLNYTPFTFLGALARFHLSKHVVVSSGAVNGGDRWIDSNYHYGYLGGVNWTSESGKTTFTSTLFVGPNQLPFFPSANLDLVDSYPVGVFTSPELQNRRNPYYNRSTFVYSSNVLVRQWSDKLTQAAEVTVVTEGNVLGLGPRGRPIRGTYYGFCHHFLYQFHDKITGVFRAEIFRDGNGLATGFDDTFNELTLGAIYKPRPNLWIRPEIRYDWAQFTHPYDDGTRGGQLTLAFDVILQF